MSLTSFWTCKRQGEAVKGDVCIKVALGTELFDTSFDRPRGRLHDPTPPMREDGASDPFRFAPVKLGDDRRVSYQHMVTAPHHRSGDRGPVADVELDPAERLSPIG